jgi:hypothetical protein
LFGDDRVVVTGQDVVVLGLGRRIEDMHLLLEHLRHGVVASVVAGNRPSTREVHDGVARMKVEEAFHVTPRKMTRRAR